MTNLEKNIEEKLTEVFKGEFEKEDFELNYLITDDVITFFFGISEGKTQSRREEDGFDLVRRRTADMLRYYQRNVPRDCDNHFTA